MAIPVDDTYGVPDGEIIYAGTYAESLSINFQEGTASEYDLSSNFPDIDGRSVGLYITAGTLPSGVMLDSLGKKLIYDGVGADTSVSITLSGKLNAPSVTFVNDTGSVPVMAGVVFPKGLVTGDIGASETGLYVTPKRTWNDGSVKHAVISGVVEAETRVTFNQTPNSGTNLTYADIQSAAPTAVVTCGSYGSVSLATLIQSLPYRTWISTPGMVECHYRGSVGITDMMVWFHVRHFSNGKTWVRIVTENPPMIRSDGTDYTYTATATIDGTQVINEVDWLHYRNAGWTTHRWVGTVQYSAVPQPDVEQIAATGLLPTYGMAPVINESDLEVLPTTASMGDDLLYPTDTSGGGSSTHIGLIPGWEAKWVVSGDYRAYQCMDAHLNAIMLYGVLWRNSAFGMMRPSDNPDGNAGSSTVISTGTNVYNPPNRWDWAHAPEAGYTYYIASGDYLALDIMMGSTALFYQLRARTGTGTDRYVSGIERGMAWLTRTLGQTVAICPDDHVNKSDWEEWLYRQCEYQKSVSIDNPVIEGSELGMIWVLNSYTTTEGVRAATWMHNFWNSAIGHVSDLDPLSDMQMTDWNTLRDWTYRSTLGSLGTTPDGFCWNFANDYTMQVSNSLYPLSTMVYADDMYLEWSDVWTATHPIDSCTNLMDTPNTATSYWGNLWPALQYAVKHSAVDANDVTAATCLSRVTNADNYSDFLNADWSSRPEYGTTAPGPVQSSSVLSTVTITETVPNDVVSFVWTPTKDINGDILAGSVANLPLSSPGNLTWCRVANTDLRQLQTKVETAMGTTWAALNYGNGNITVTQNAWVGGAVDHTNGKMYIPWGGGHADMSVNMVYHLDVNRMGNSDTWSIDQLPSDPENATYPWSDGYKNLTCSTSYTSYCPQELPYFEPYDRLPDGLPTSRHTYDTTCFDSARNRVIQGRKSLTYLDLDSDESSTINITYGGVEVYPVIYNNWNYNHIQDNFYGIFRPSVSSYQLIATIDPDTAIATQVDSGTDYGSNGLHLHYASCLMTDQDKFIYAGGNPDQWWTYDLTTSVKQSGQILGDALLNVTYGSMDSIAWIPDWSLALRRSNVSDYLGDWYLLDISTNLQTNVNGFISGLEPPMVTSSGIRLNPGKKCFYYPDWKCVIYSASGTPDDDAIYIMRTG